MSQHPSLKQKKFQGKRSVRKRYERYAKMKRNMKFIEGMSIYGMPKEKIESIKLKIKDEKKETKEEGLTALTLGKDEKKKKTSKDVGKIK